MAEYLGPPTTTQQQSMKPVRLEDMLRPSEFESKYLKGMTLSDQVTAEHNTCTQMIIEQACQFDFLRNNPFPEALMLPIKDEIKKVLQKSTSLVAYDLDQLLLSKRDDKMNIKLTLTVWTTV
jgi:hypothetical protein